MNLPAVIVIKHYSAPIETIICTTEEEYEEALKAPHYSGSSATEYSIFELKHNYTKVVEWKEDV